MSTIDINSLESNFDMYGQDDICMSTEAKVEPCPVDQWSWTGSGGKSTFH